MSIVVGSILEVSRGNHSAHFEWRLRRSEAEEIGRDVRYLGSPPVVSFAGWQWGLDLGMEDSSSEKLHLRLRRWRGQSPAPVVRYSVGARTEDEGPEEEEIGRGTMESDDFYWESVPHPWLRVSELKRRRRLRRPSSSSGTFLSISLRLRTGPETEDEMKSLAGREEAASSLEAAVEKLTETDLKDPETGGASGSASRPQETTPEDSEDNRILREHLKKMLLHASDHDATFKVKGKEFKAHKSVLRARSPVFEAMFTHPMRENEEDVVTVEDLDPECFGAFLAYVYTGEAEGLSAADATGLYYAADKYDFPALRRRCVDVLQASLSITLVCDVITLAVTHGEEELLESAMAYVTDRLVEIMETVEWQRFALRNPVMANEVCLKAIKRRLHSDPQ